MCLPGGFWQTLTCLFSLMIKICQSIQIDLGNDPHLAARQRQGGSGLSAQRQVWLAKNASVSVDIAAHVS